MSRHTRVGGGNGTPFIAHLMQVRVADAAKEDFDFHIAIGGLAAWDACKGERGGRAGGGVSFGVGHEGRGLRSGLRGLVLFVGDVFHPLHDLAIKTFLDGDVRHRGGG